jgi:hypothetical protein
VSNARCSSLPLLLALAALAPFRASEAQVTFERAGYRLTSIGERITVQGRVVDSRRQPVASTSIRWRVADPSIASVTPQGVLVSRRVGNTKLWAVAGDDSASALILVDQWAAKFDFLPPTVRLDSKGAKAPLRIIVRDAAGHPIASQNRRPTSCRSLNERIASLAPNGEITARDNGVTYIRCADRGIADSARVEVRQRPARATIVDKASFVNKVVGDTMRLRVNASDAAGRPIENVQATWASMNPSIASVDPLTGFARLIGPGTATIIAQAGDVTDTLSVGVAAGSGLPVPLNADAAGDAANLARVPTLKIEASYPFAGDTSMIRFTARDASGIEVPNPAVTLESSDTSIFAVLSRNRIVARKPGSAYVVGRFGAATMDSGQIIVRLKSNITATATVSGPSATFRRPTFNVDSFATAYTSSRDSINKLIFDSTRVLGLKAPWFLISAALAGGQATHSFADSTGKEERAGFVYGGLAELRAFRVIKLGGEFRTGSLSSSGATGTDLTVTEMAGTLTIQPAEAFAFGGSYTLRATREGQSALPLAIQQWTFPRAFVSIRPAFVGGAVRTSMGVNVLLPGATYTGYIDQQGNAVNPQALSLGGEAGLDFVRGGFRIGLTYNVESFRFPKVGTSERRDQFSMIRFKAGWEYAR